MGGNSEERDGRAGWAGTASVMGERDGRGGEEHLVEEERKTAADKSLMRPKE
jgi:hypothetical protein